MYDQLNVLVTGLIKGQLKPQKQKLLIDEI